MREMKAVTRLLLLTKLNNLNRSVKETDWSYEDKQRVYRLKDEVLRRIVQEHPEGLQVSLYYVPFIRYGANVPERATVEVVVECMGEKFSFHQPIAWARESGVEVERLEKKEWVNERDFNHAVLAEAEKVIADLLAQLDAEV